MVGIALGMEVMAISNNKISSLSLSPCSSQSGSGVATPNVFRDQASNVNEQRSPDILVCLGC